MTIKSALPIIGVDIDAVLCHSSPLFCHLLGETLKRAVTEAEITHYDFMHCLPIDADQNSAVLRRYKDDLETLAPLPDAVSSVKELQRHGRVWLLTSRSIESAGATSNWLRAHEITPDALIFAPDKAPFATALSLMFEDKWETACAFADRGTPVVLFDYPWNRVEPATKAQEKNIRRVANWREALELFDIAFATESATQAEENVLDEY